MKRFPRGAALEDSPIAYKTRSIPLPFPVPIKGWNARDAIGEMDPRFALRLDNIIPRSTYLEWRRGQEDYTTGLTGQVNSFLKWNGPSAAKKLFAAAGANIYDVSASGAVGAAVQSGLGSDQWQSTMFTNSAGSFLVAANQADAVRNYDGTSWTTPAITGVTVADLNCPLAFKARLWFTQKNTLDAWYLGPSSIAGAATKFPVGPLFKEGGSLLTIAAMSRDGGSGPDDFICFFTTEGEVAVYQGADPATGLLLVGVYRIPKLLGRRCVVKQGGDLLLLTEQGVYPMSKAIASSLFLAKDEVTFNISPVLQSDASLYASSFGWQLELFSDQNLLIANVPSTGVGGSAVQYVMDTITGAWCRFLGWNTPVVCAWDKKLFLGGSTKTIRALNAATDFGSDLAGELFTAFSRLRNGVQYKHLKMVRPHMLINGPLQMQLAVLKDFQVNPDYQYGNVELAAGAGGVWDADLWDSGVWAYDDFNPLEWKTVGADPAAALAIGLRAYSGSVTVKLSAFDLLFETGGVALS